MLRLVVPKGTLEKMTFQLFEDADLAISRDSAVTYKAAIDDPRISEVRVLRPQEIPRYIADGLFDFGLAGRDNIEETAADVVELGQLDYAKQSNRPGRIVLAVANDSPWQAVEDLPQGVRVATEWLSFTQRYLGEKGINADVQYSHGATEAKVPDIVDAVVEFTETGSGLRAAGLRIIDELLVSGTVLMANKEAYADPKKAHAMDQILTLLQGTLEARGKVLVKLNVAAANLDDVIAKLPSMKSPTVSKLFGDDAYAVETVVPKTVINTLIPELKDHGATDIIELPLSKIIH
ncbi:MAG TPA: ATP phosphoribosyltransferase [Acidimicrobiales bacterium]|nr:ATP phosphoribosyltransferase [Acidimicrobiales bacterium]